MAKSDKLAMMQIDASDYYQRAPTLGATRCCSGRVSQQQQQQQQQLATMATGTSERSLKISTTVRGAELLCCCCSCSTTTSAKSPGLVASLGVGLLVFGYTLLGAFAFMALEGGFKGSSLHQELPSVVTSTVGGSSSSAGGGSVENGKIELPAAVGHLGEHGGAVAGSSSNNLSIAMNPSVITSSSSETTSSRPVVPPPSLLQPNHRDDIIVEDSSTRQLRAHTVERLWSITEDLNVLYKENWTRLAEREVLDFQEKMAQHSLDRARSGSSIYGTTAVQRAGSATVARRNNDKRLPGLSPLMKQTQRRWTFGSSFLYSITLITTIGYGSTSPRTVWGRLITVIYALAGIPLMLVYLSTIGDVLGRTFRRLYGRACGRVECIRDGNRAVRGGCQSSASPAVVPTVPGIIGKTSYHRYDNHIETKLSAAGANAPHHQFYSSKSSSSDELGLIRSTGSGLLLDCGGEGAPAPSTFPETNSASAGNKRHHRHHHFYPCSSQLSEPTAVCLVRIPISLCFIIILLYICCGAIMFNRLEGWSLLEGSYFCFTSLGTIGFGDLVPSGGNASTHILEELSLCACSLYILAGMGLVAMCFNLIQDEVVRVVRVFGRTCGMSPVTNCTGACIINNPPPPPPPPSTAVTATSGIKSDLSVHVERDVIGPPCAASILNNDSRIALGQHNYDHLDPEDEEEAIANLVPTS